MKKAFIIALLLILLMTSAFAGEKKVDAVTSASPATAKNPRPEKIVKEEILNWLKSHWQVSVATASPEGTPYISGVIYANEGHIIYFRAMKTTQKIKNISKNPRVAYTIWDPVKDMGKLKSLQMLGKAKILKGSERERVVKLFKGPPVSDEYAVVAVYPLLARWTDNTISFGNSEVVKFK